MENKQSLPFWVWLLIGFFALAILKVGAVVLGGLVMVFQAFAAMSPKEKSEMIHRAHLAHSLHHNSKNKDKHK
ncbi:hypothetical protein G7B40_017105 [Aetokthonos hydrillicola Thurmond2011]|jgi:hypothetical protein|uniref:Uncharacterized protein n=1 Tax=Aetokthonos hydrillicola Thurmond2011 TaxID=2712845 RepID=A0AAP5IBY7_9CYAN|nr:hypothetical protein [Aetokthonos hydrillicola]MBO3463702.1 hypothetical protein [Aetokthonos hydrillicola CCALA 1050]MBW4588592.1 hypothetical protein [Aetokthonos hydrillicola CCALA 1050]MDR9896265.1 hypothetical protein [Aetokthonos hydrillicola Thurmond2011]